MLRVLVVDDEQQCRDNMIECINQAQNGFEIIGAASDGQEALSMIRELRPDIALVDIQMPGMSGLDVISHARREGLEVAFIIISSYGEFTFAQTALRLGVEEYLLKPFMPQDVCAAVYKVAKRILSSGLLPAAQEASSPQKRSFGPGMSSRTPISYPFDLERTLLDAIQTGVSEQIEAALSRYYEATMENNLTETARVNCLTILYIELHHLAMNRGIEFTAVRTPAAGEIWDAAAFYGVLLQLARDLGARFARQGVNSSAVPRAIAYIRENYAQKLSLEQVAKEIYVSPAYLSGLFRRTVGLSFTDYVHQIRIENAKRLMREQPYLKNYELSEMVGYPSDKYFAQVFKKLTGMTVYQYKAQLNY